MKENLTDQEIYKLCETEQGTLKYIIDTIRSNDGFYNWAYLNETHAPIVTSLVAMGYLSKRKSHSGVFEFQPTKQGREYYVRLTT